MALRENDVARRIDDRTAFPARRKGTARGVDIAFTPVGRQGRAVSPCRRNIYVFTVNRTAVRRVEAAGRIAFGINLNVFNSDDCIFSRRKDGIGPFGIRSDRRVGKGRRTVRNEEDGILTVKITAIFTGRMSRLGKANLLQGHVSALFCQDGIFIGLISRDILIDQKRLFARNPLRSGKFRQGFSLLSLRRHALGRHPLWRHPLWRHALRRHPLWRHALRHRPVRKRYIQGRYDTKS